MKQAQAIFKPIPSMVPAVKGNAITHEKIELGKLLFFDPHLSESEIISCNTCHNLATGGVDAGPTSVGHAWQKGPRRAPTVYNAVFNIAQFWDGRAADLKAQAKGPMQASVEMASTPDRIVTMLSSMPGYVEAFKKAFPNDTSPVTFDNVAKALEAFEATLITPASRFDQFLQGDATALTAEEKQGLKLFMDKGCSSCHNGINIGGEAYFPFGVVEKPGAEILPPTDKGRFAVTQTASDQYVFRAAPLRNVALRAPYFHSSREAGSCMGAKPTKALGTTTRRRKAVEQTHDATFPKLDPAAALESVEVIGHGSPTGNGSRTRARSGHRHRRRCARLLAA